MHRTRPRAGGSPTGSPAAAPPRRPRGVLAAAAAGLAALALLLPATAAAAPATGPAPATARAPGGTLLMVGGALDDHNTEVYGEIVDRAGGPAARIGVLTAGSVPPSQDPDAGTPQARNSEANGAYYAGLLESHGAGSAEWIPVDLDRVAAADDPELAGRVSAMTGFFIGGGDQYRYVTTLLRDGGTRDSAVLAAVRQRLAEGAVVAGTSARRPDPGGRRHDHRRGELRGAARRLLARPLRGRRPARLPGDRRLRVLRPRPGRHPLLPARGGGPVPAPGRRHRARPGLRRRREHRPGGHRRRHRQRAPARPGRARGDGA
ncbi:hypothetical protein LUW77_22540 [Streptomyces radiopugnans]|nr:hypothetical protein LUW77_22540 [Streptomyces radiopugnans]